MLSRHSGQPRSHELRTRRGGARFMKGPNAIHRAFVAGDVAILRTALGDPPDFPDCPLPSGFGGHCLEYAIYHSPAALVRTLLDLGADPNYSSPGGFPSLLAAISSGRRDRCDLLKLLLDSGADIQQRGINDWTPLHAAAAANDIRAIAVLVDRGADPTARTRIDD